MVVIETVQAVPVEGGFFFDDQAALKAGAQENGFGYIGESVTPGYDRIRQPAKALSILLTLSDGSVVVGDCAAVQYSGAGSRDSVFRPSEWTDTVETTVAEALEGRAAEPFRANVRDLESQMQHRSHSLHTAIQYGLSQALLAASAESQRITMAEVVVDAFGTTPATSPVPIYAQSGDSRRRNAEKMILKGVDFLPHGLFNSVAKIGRSGERLLDYLSWLANRVEELGEPGYTPTFHVDVYGNLGDIFGPPYDRREVMDYFTDLSTAAEPYNLQIEGPMDEGSRSAQIDAMKDLRSALSESDIDVDLVADEWCDKLEDIQAFVDAGAADVVQIKTPDLGGVQNTVQAVQYCQDTDSKPYLGGSCAETDIAGRVSAQIAVGTDPYQVLAKPGMGVDEGVMIVENEMRRTVARMNAR